MRSMHGKHRGIDNACTHARSRPAVTNELLQKWQDTVNTMAELIGVPAALIMKADGSSIEVLRSSESNGNPYEVGHNEGLAGLYCEEVIKRGDRLLVPNALKSKRWKENPDIKLGMISYLGYPLMWPDGSVFGTLCVLDSKENNYSETQQRLMVQFKQLVESQLALVSSHEVMKEDLLIKDRAINASTQGISITDPNQPDNPVIYVNQGFENLTGYGAEEMLGRNMRFLQGADTDPETVKAIHSTVQGQGTYAGEILNYRKDGAPFWNQLSLSPVFDAAGQLTQFVGVHTDITKQREAEQALRKSEEKYRSVLRDCLDGFWRVDVEGRILEVNEAYCHITGYSRDELLNMTIGDIEAVESAQDVTRHIGAIRNLGSDRFETKHRRKDGRVVDIEAVARASEDGATFFTFMRDITERKQKELELQASEERYRQLVSTSTDSIMLFDAESREIIDANKAAEDLYGYNRTEFLALTHHDITTEPQESDASISQTISGRPVKIPIRYHKKKDGTVFPVEIAGSSFMLGDRRLICGLIRDITQRKRMEDEMAKIAQEWQTTFDATNDAIWILDHEKRILRCNRTTERMFRWKNSDVLGKHCCEVVHGAQGRPPANCPLQRAKVSLQRETMELLISETWYQVTVDPILNEEGACVGAVHIISNISQRKQAETFLRASEEKYRRLVDTLNEGIWQIDQGGYTSFVNPKMAQMLGYSPCEMQGKHLFSFMDTEWEVKAKENMRRRQEGIVEQHEFCFKAKDGQAVWTLISTSPMLDKQGEYTGALASVVDITEKKKSEDALRQSEAKLKLAQGIAKIGNWSWDVATDEVEWSDQVYAIFRAPRQEPSCEFAESFVHPDDLDLWSQTMKEAVEREEAFALDHRALRSDGETIWVRTETRAVFNEQGVFIGYNGTVQDITERKRDEARLLDYQARLKALASEMTLTEERLKRTVAGELHDRISQSLAVAKMSLASLQESTQDVPVQETLAEVTDVLAHTLKEARSLTSQLSYPALNVLGLSKAIELWLKEEVRDKHGLHINFVEDGLNIPMDEDVRTVLFRCVREALSNAIKHARAQRVTVKISQESEDLVISVADDGIGFEYDMSGKGDRGFGILSTRESLERLGGTLEIETRPNSGCACTCRLPLSAAVLAASSAEGESKPCE